jgi:electron transfer flavoprotein alpha subunit
VTADPQKCGLVGSPTRVLASFENQSGKRKCSFVRREELADVISRALTAQRQKAAPTDEVSRERLGKVLSVGEAPRGFAEAVSDNVIEVAPTDADTLAECILAQDPDAVIWGSDARSGELAARVAARLSLGLCADCTHLAVEEGTLAMYRPALSGSVIAKIKSLTRPSMATVRTEKGDAGDVIVAAGFGVREQLDRVKEFADSLGATLCASRKLVDGGFATYERQVGLTGSRVAPPVYVAVGISGAVHHIVGMERSGVVIAINPDKNAPIFEYADYGIVDTF